MPWSFESDVPPERHFETELAGAPALLHASKKDLISLKLRTLDAEQRRRDVNDDAYQQLFAFARSHSVAQSDTSTVAWSTARKKYVLENGTEFLIVAHETGPEFVLLIACGVALGGLIHRTVEYFLDVLRNENGKKPWLKDVDSVRLEIRTTTQAQVLLTLPLPRRGETIRLDLHVLAAALGQQPMLSTDGGRTKVMFFAANPLATSRLDLEEELRGIANELRSVKFRERIELIAHHAVRPDDLLRCVRTDKPAIIHFSGHGAPSGIVLKSDSGQPHVVSGAALDRFLTGRGVELIVLNSCFAAAQAAAVCQAVRSVVGTTSAVTDEAARRFSCAFYRSIGDGLTVGEAFRDGGDAVTLNGFSDVFQSFGELDWRPLRV